MGGSNLISKIYFEVFDASSSNTSSFNFNKLTYWAEGTSDLSSFSSSNSSYKYVNYELSLDTYLATSDNIFYPNVALI